MIRLASSCLVLSFALIACSSDEKGSSPGPLSDASTSSDAGGGTGGKPSVKDSGGGGEDSGGGDSGGGPYPKKLSQAGLFSDMAAETLADGVRAYEPRYKLWSDGADKRRWFRLPPGTKIDTTDMDFWKYPVGTTAWKEFSLNGKKLETRMLRKMGPKPTDWLMIAYQWNAEQTDAVAVPDGVMDVAGTQHDIPSAADCNECHGNMKDRLLGITAIQLSHSPPGMTLSDLIKEGALTATPAGAFVLPGPAVAETALGYLHANCGHCHNEHSSVSLTVGIRLWELTGKLGSVPEMEGYRTTVGQDNSFKPEFHVIEPGDPDHSELFYRISRRGGGQMPPIATEIVDDTGVADVRAWIESMPKVSVDGGPEAGTGPADASTRD